MQKIQIKSHKNSDARGWVFNLIFQMKDGYLCSNEQHIVYFFLEKDFPYSTIIKEKE